MRPSRRSTFVIALTMLATLAASVAVRRWVAGSYVALPAHAALETTGGLATLFVAALTLLMHEDPERAQPRIARACAFIAMGSLDIVHGCLEAGPLFVWLRTAATLAGGVLFAMSRPPPRLDRHARLLPLATGLATLAFVVASFALRRALPGMESGPAFSSVADFMNVAGGLAFFVGAARIAPKGRGGSTEDVVFSGQACLFGLAGVLFPLSQLWAADWWLWHVLRFVASLVALGYVGHLYVRLDRELAEANEALRGALRTRDDFLSVASHELRTPLTPLVLRLQSLDRALLDARPADRQLVQKALASARRLAALVEDLLDVSRIAAGRLSVKREYVRLSDVVRAQVESTRTTCPGRSIGLTACPSDLVVDGDEGRLAQVVGNLLDNAIKYSPDGAAIEVGLSDCDGEAWIVVEDSGIGIAQDDLPRLFQRYFRTEAASELNRGLGLGLFICREIVEQHQGRIWAESRLGVGTKFIVALPQASEPKRLDDGGAPSAGAPPPET